MENWRKFAEENDFVILCENYDQGSLTEEQFCNRWEQLILSEAEQVLSEDLLDVLRAGYEKGKELFLKAIAKVANFFDNLVSQALGLLTTAKIKVSRLIGVLKNITEKMKKFLATNPIVRKAVNIVLIMLTITSVAFHATNEAQAAINVGHYTGDETQLLTDEEANEIRGYLYSMQDFDERGRPSRSAENYYIAEAVNTLELLHSREAVRHMEQLDGTFSELIKDAYEGLQTLQEENPEYVENLAEIGAEVQAAYHTIGWSISSQPAPGEEPVRHQTERPSYVDTSR